MSPLQTRLQLYFSKIFNFPQNLSSSIIIKQWIYLLSSSEQWWRHKRRNQKTKNIYYESWCLTNEFLIMFTAQQTASVCFIRKWKLRKDKHPPNKVVVDFLFKLYSQQLIEWKRQQLMTNNIAKLRACWELLKNSCSLPSAFLVEVNDDDDFMAIQRRVRGKGNKKKVLRFIYKSGLTRDGE